VLATDPTTRLGGRSENRSVTRSAGDARFQALVARKTPSMG